MTQLRHSLCLVTLASTFLLSGCFFSVPTEKVVETINKAKTLSGSVQEYQKRLDDFVEFGKMKGTEIIEGAEEVKQRVDDVVEGIEKVQEGIDLIRGGGDGDSPSNESE